MAQPLAPMSCDRIRRRRPLESGLLALGLCYGALGCGKSTTAPTPADPATPAVDAVMNRGVSLMGQYQYDPAADIHYRFAGIEYHLHSALNLPRALP